MEKQAERLNRIKNQEGGWNVLIGAGFWEGIDLNLDCLVIWKYPFSPFDDPVLYSRVFFMLFNAFREYQRIERGKRYERVINRVLGGVRKMLGEEAFIRFRQGIGRAIRKEGDTCEIYVYDSRAEDAVKFLAEYEKYWVENVLILKKG